MAKYHVIKNKIEMDTKKKAMICQPMNGLSEDEILSIRQKAIEWLESMGYEFVDSFIEENCEDENVKHIPIWYLAKSIEKMSTCNSVYFCKGWENNRGCIVEHMAAEKYGLEIIEENREDE